MKIPCPHCGDRDLGEFVYGGDASKKRPEHGSKGAKTWHDFAFVFENPKGRILNSGTTPWGAANGSS